MRNRYSAAPALRRKRFRLLRERDGNSLVECAIALPVLVLLLVGVVDFGRAYFIDIQVASAARAGAAYGVQSFTDTAGMVTAAKVNAPSIPSLSAVATFGCECHDGSATSVSCRTNPSCPQNVVNYAEVTTIATYTTLLPYPGIPPSIKMQSTVRMRVSQ